MDVKQGYRATDVGALPAEWGLVPFSELLEFRNGVNADKAAYGGGVRFINVLEVITKSHLSASDIPGRISLPEQALAPYAVRRGDVVFNRTSETQAEVGLAAVYNDDELVVFGGFVIRGRPTTSEALDPIYSGYALRSKPIRRQVIARGQGAIRANIGQQDLRSVLVPRPPLPEQRAIATALRDVDALLGALDRLIDKKRDLKQAAMQQLLTGKTRLPGFSGKWETQRLGEVLQRITNGAVYSAAGREGVQITRIETIADGTIDYARTGLAKWSSALAQYELRRSDILFSHINSIDHIGKVALFAGDRPLYHGMNLLLLRAGTGCDATFLYFWLSSEPARRRMRTLAKQAVSQASINTAELRLVAIDLPSVPEQEAIAAVLSDVDAELKALEQRRDKTRLLKQGMMQELLTGRTRLV